jgi:cytoskeletal protein RodZ
MADSKKNDNDDRSPRFSKALMGRVVAVGLFVVLGTFAVATSMNRTGEPTDQVALNEASSDDVTPEKKSPLASAFATKPPASSPTVSRAQSKPMIQGTFKKPASSGSVTGSRSGNSTNGFAIRTPAAKPKVPTVNTAFARSNESSTNTAKRNVGSSEIANRSRWI